jgi:pyridoxamine 5'-phosphate oxidase family protein
MMSFNDEEIAYLRSQRLARIATVGADGQPDASPVGFEFDGTYFYVGGHHDVENTRKFRNVVAGNSRIALIIDDLVSVDPWTPRFLRVYGSAESVNRPGQFGAGSYLRITPRISWSWNLGDNPRGSSDFAPRRTVHAESGA